MTIHVIHEHREWLPPFADALDAQGLPWEEWFLDGGVLDLAAPPRVAGERAEVVEGDGETPTR